MAMLRVLLDTNILVSSFYGGNPRKIIELLDLEAFILCLSPPILQEYIETLQEFPVFALQFEKLLYYCERAESVVNADLLPNLTLVKKDPDDDKFIECASALKADYIVSGDKALLEVGKYQKTKIVTPKQFLDIIHEHNQ